MRIVAAIFLVLLPLGAASATPSPERQAAVPPNGEIATRPADSFDRMNAFRQTPGCRPILNQVAGDGRRRNGTRLDQQPPGRLILAVDRQVDGCHEIVFLGRERR